MRDQARKSEQIHINRFLQLVVDIKDLQVSINTDRTGQIEIALLKFCTIQGVGKFWLRLEFFIRLHICSK